MKIMSCKTQTVRQSIVISTTIQDQALAHIYANTIIEMPGTEET